MADRILLRVDGKYVGSSGGLTEDRSLAFDYARASMAMLLAAWGDIPGARMVRVRTVSRAEAERRAWNAALEAAAKAATAHAAVQATLSGAAVCSAADAIRKLAK